ncbi:MAG: tryptophan tryptophylquinone biosynthesis enzyme MauG [Rhodospirillales bacterium]|nr:tryptophan tryptophylquinone biosynthesis enzyme MauG [Rhodospirillales bacterium]
MACSLARIVLLSLCCLMSTTVMASEPADAERQAAKAAYRRPETIPFPLDDPYTAAKATLGEQLFFDPLLSGSGTRSCATCHNPGLSWGDGLPRAIGENQVALPLRAPTLLNVAWIEVLGWDGKFRNLESVAFGPLLSPGNMNTSETQLVERLSAIPGYASQFATAFPDDGITRRTTEQALATYERTIVSAPAPFDRWIEGDEAAIDETAKRGFDLFRTKAGCAECHRGWSFTEGSFYDIGTAEDADIGRGRIFTNSPMLMHAFKVPTLRDVARRAPYLHDGSVATLAQMIDLYDSGGIDRPSRSELIKPLGLTDEEKTALLAFLATLTSDPTPVPTPILPR